MRSQGDIVVEARGLVAGYGGRVILRDVDLTVARGEIAMILGGSGSGKSTLLRSLVGLLPPIDGSVRLFGEELQHVEPGRRAALLRRTGMLFQSDALFTSMSVLENVLLPLRELTRLPLPVMQEMARHKLGLMGLAGMEDRMPSTLSGGQRKRAALARASILDPEVIFCDEPTSGLDPVTSAKLAQYLLKLRDVLGVTVIAVTHDIDTVREVADRAILFAHGRLCADGSVEALERDPDPLVHAFFHRGAPLGAERQAARGA